MKRVIQICLLIMTGTAVFAQKENREILKGNEAYKKQDYIKATDFYQRAVKQSPTNHIASFNLGNALFRANKQEEAIQQFEVAAGAGNNKVNKADALYNKGVVLTKQKKLDESIVAYKNALRVNPLDSLARENLQRALNEQKKQQEQQQNKKDQQQNKQQNKLNKQQVMQMLNALQEQEKQLQQKMQKSKVPSPGQPEKDW
jgi:tetratricopeptide (TPR) repeat protein